MSDCWKASASCRSRCAISGWPDMPGCVLRATGAKFDVDAFLSESPFRPATAYRKGQRRRPASRGTQTASGFNVVVTDTDDPPEKQIEYARTFLRDQQCEILRPAPSRAPREHDLATC